MEAAKLYKQAV